MVKDFNLSMCELPHNQVQFFANVLLKFGNLRYQVSGSWLVNKMLINGVVLELRKLNNQISESPDKLIAKLCEYSKEFERDYSEKLQEYRDDLEEIDGYTLGETVGKLCGYDPKMCEYLHQIKQREQQEPDYISELFVTKLCNRIARGELTVQCISEVDFATTALFEADGYGLGVRIDYEHNGGDPSEVVYFVDKNGTKHTSEEWYMWPETWMTADLHMAFDMALVLAFPDDYKKKYQRINEQYARNYLAFSGPKHKP